MEETIVEIPQDTGEGWVPPVIETRKREEERHESAADVFFMQYTVCILLLTAVLLLRVLDGEVYEEVAGTFAERTAAPEAAWLTALGELVRSLWH